VKKRENVDQRVKNQNKIFKKAQIHEDFSLHLFLNLLHLCKAVLVEKVNGWPLTDIVFECSSFKTPHATSMYCNQYNTMLLPVLNSVCFPMLNTKRIRRAFCIASIFALNCVWTLNLDRGKHLNNNLSRHQSDAALLWECFECGIKQILYVF